MISNETEFVMVGREDPKCPYCEFLKNYLDERNVDYTYIDIEAPGMRDYFAEQGLTKVPQFWHRGTLIGGYDKTTIYMGGLLNGSGKARP